MNARVDGMESGELILAAMKEQQEWQHSVSFSAHRAPMMCLFGVAQLGCRHPDVSNEMRATVRRMVDSFADAMMGKEWPANRELIRRGWDAKHDRVERVPDENGHFGNYDDESEALLLKLQARGIALLVAGGVKGSGFSISARGEASCPTLAMALREVADRLEARYGKIHRD